MTDSQFAPSVRRVRKLQLLAALVVALLVGRLAQLQLLSGGDYVERAERTRRRVVWRPAVRGGIVDRHGVDLASSAPVYDVVGAPIDVDPLIGLAGSIAWAMRERGETADARAERLRAIHALLAAGERRLRVETKPASLPRLAALAREGRLALEIETHRAGAPELDAEAEFDLAAAEATDPEAHVFALLDVPDETMSARTASLAEIARLLELPLADLEAAFAKNVTRCLSADHPGERRARLRQRRPVAEDVGFEAAARLEEAQSREALPGIAVAVRAARRWPRGPIAAHVIGRTSSVDGAEMERFLEASRVLDRRPRGETADDDADLDAKDLDDGVSPLERAGVPRPELGDRLYHDRIGRSGVERRWDHALAGVPGVRLVERDAFGRTRRVLEEVAPVDGVRVRLALDAAMQERLEAYLDDALAEHGLPGHGAAAAVIDVRDGSILALTSAPRYDPNRFSEDYAANRSREDRPLLHRGVSAFTPGSTWKPLVGLAAGEVAAPIPSRPVAPSGPRRPGFGVGPGAAPSDPEGGEAEPFHFDARATIHCGGTYSPTSRRFTCWIWNEARTGHGPLDLAGAIEGSCNIYFMKLAERMGPARFTDFARRMRIGVPPFHDLPGAASGSIPSSGWSTGEIRNMGIGQGRLLATPLQIARVAASVARGTPAPPSRLVLEPARPFPPEDARAPRFSAATLDALRRGMWGAAHTPRRGTASNPRIGLSELDVAVKTGTAQIGRTVNSAWVMGYYPARAEPRIAFAVVIDRTKAHGGSAAGPVITRLIRWLEGGDEADEADEATPDAIARASEGGH